MFGTLIFQYLNKLPEGKVGNFATPEAFHAVKVERLGDNCIKPSAQVRGKFIVPIKPLVGNMPIQPRKFTDSTPPVIRPSNPLRLSALLSLRSSVKDLSLIHISEPTRPY